MVFGRSINNFSDYSNVDESANFDLILERRLFEIQKLFCDFYRKAKINIHVAQENQRFYQDEAHNVLEYLKPGSKVF